MNRATLIGRLGRDPEIRHTASGDAVANLSLATTERWKDRNGERKEKVEWHRVTLWGKLGEVAQKHLRKGDQIMIEGRIETRKWQDQSGQDRYTTEIRGERLEMLGGSSNGKTPDFDPGNEGSTPSPPSTGGGDLDDEIPF